MSAPTLDREQVHQLLLALRAWGRECPAESRVLGERLRRTAPGAMSALWRAAAADQGYATLEEYQSAKWLEVAALLKAEADAALIASSVCQIQHDPPHPCGAKAVALNEGTPACADCASEVLCPWCCCAVAPEGVGSDWDACAECDAERREAERDWEIEQSLAYQDPQDTPAQVHAAHERDCPEVQA